MHRIAISLLVLVLLGTFGLGYSMTSLYNTLRSEDQAPDTRAYVRTLGSHLAETLDSMPAREEFINSWNRANNLSLEIVSLAQFSISETVLAELVHKGPLALQDANGVRLNYYLKNSGDVLVVRAPNSAADDPSGLQMVLTIIFYAGLLLLAIAWLAPLLYRLQKLRTAAASFGKGHFETRIAPSAVSYISDIELEFNRMADRIANLVEDVKLLSSALSHEMRTPLAKLRMGIDTLQEHDDPSERARYLEKLSRTVDQLTELVESTLEFSRLDFMLDKAGKSRVDLVPLIRACTAKVRSPHTDIQLDTDRESCLVTGNESYLIIMVMNIIVNAEKYGNGCILARLRCRGAAVSLSVEDDGPGFEAGAARHVFLPFQRGRVQSTKSGFGLGLAVAQRIATWHGAHIKIDQAQQLKGARVTLLFE